MPGGYAEKMQAAAQGVRAIQTGSARTGNLAVVPTRAEKSSSSGAGRKEARQAMERLARDIPAIHTDFDELLECMDDGDASGVARAAKNLERMVDHAAEFIGRLQSFTRGVVEKSR